jgi:hypothetical protein
MPPTQNVLWSQVVLPSLALFGLAGSLLGIAVGVGLVLNSRATLDLFRRMNRWVSTRQAMKPLEIPRNVETAGPKPRWNGLVFVIAGAYVSIVLWQVNAGKAVSAVTLGTRSVMTEILLNASRWIMVAGGLAAVAVGIMLLFFPAAFARFETRANRWYSTRRALSGGDAMHMPLDRWVESFPRASGALIACLSVVSALAFGLLKLGKL